MLQFIKLETDASISKSLFYEATESFVLTSHILIYIQRMSEKEARKRNKEVGLKAWVVERKFTGQVADGTENVKLLLKRKLFRKTWS